VLDEDAPIGDMGIGVLPWMVDVDTLGRMTDGFSRSPRRMPDATDVFEEEDGASWGDKDDADDADEGGMENISCNLLLLVSASVEEVPAPATGSVAEVGGAFGAGASVENPTAIGLAIGTAFPATFNGAEREAPLSANFHTVVVWNLVSLGGSKKDCGGGGAAGREGGGGGSPGLEESSITCGSNGLWFFTVGCCSALGSIFPFFAEALSASPEGKLFEADHAVPMTTGFLEPVA